MKTIFIPIFQGVEARNILRTDAFEILKNTGAKIILFVNSKEKKEYFEKEFNGPNVVYEITPAHRLSFLGGVFSVLKFNLINTKTIDLKRRMKYEQDGKIISYFFKLAFNRIFARRFFRKLVRFLDYAIVKDHHYSAYFEKYKPDLVFLAHLFGDDEVAILKDAKSRRVKSVGLITSWDKTTGRCMLRLLPDKLIVYNETVKEEAVNFADMQPVDITVVGVPQYDFYFRNKPKSREEFCSDWGINNGKKIVVFAPSGRERGDADRSLIRIVYGILNTELASFNVQLIVRFPPNDKVDLDADLLNKDIIYQKPGHKFSGERGVDWDMNFLDLQELVDTLSYSDLVISLTSSIAIDAALFDKPIINVRFNDINRYPLMKKPIRYFDTEHYSKFLSTNGVTVVRNEEELISWIKKYLEYPSANAESRKKIIEQQCWKYDGLAGRRIADLILNYLN